MDIAHSIQSIGFLTDFSESVLVYPIVLSTHLACIALFGGMILMTNLRLLGLTFRSVTITDMVTSLSPWKRVGGTVMIVAGLLLATSEAENMRPILFSGPR
jgi:hypothetical protein